MHSDLRIIKETANSLAVEAVKSMKEEEAVAYVRALAAVLTPMIGEGLNPVQQAIAAFTVLETFDGAFTIAYKHMEKRLEAQEAIEKALGGLK